MTEIKKASTQNEIKMIADLASEIWTEHYTQLIGLPQVAYMLEKYQSQQGITSQINEGEYIYYITLVNGEIAGYCGIRPEQGIGRIFLSKLYIKKEYRKQGLARLNLNHFLSAYGDGIHAIYLTVNKDNLQAIAAYQKLGFAITDSIVTDIGNGYVMDDYVLTLHVDTYTISGPKVLP